MRSQRRFWRTAPLVIFILAVLWLVLYANWPDVTYLRATVVEGEPLPYLYDNHSRATGDVQRAGLLQSGSDQHESEQYVGSVDTFGLGVVGSQQLRSNQNLVEKNLKYQAVMDKGEFSKDAVPLRPLKFDGTELVLTIHVPKNHWSCNPIGGVSPAACGVLGDVPVQSAGGLEESCGPREDGYIRHYQYFTYVALLSQQLRAQTGVHVEYTIDPCEADIMVCNHVGIKHYWHKCRSRNDTTEFRMVLVVEDIDGGSVVTKPEYLQDSRVLGVLKHYVWRSRSYLCRLRKMKTAELPSQASYPYRAHAILALIQGGYQLEGPLTIDNAEALIQKNGKNCTLPPEAAVAAKVKAAIPSYFIVKHFNGTDKAVLPRFEELRPIAQREFDVGFVGSLWSGTVRYHRAGLMQRLRSLESSRGWNVFAQESIPRREFYRVLANVKIFVSPWGLGEWSGKDDEAVLSGAVLAKPGASLFDSAVSLYQNITCLDVRPDWTDLEDVLAKALADQEQLQRMQEMGHRMLQGFFTYGRAVQQEAVVRSFKELLVEAKEKRLAGYRGSNLSPGVL